MSGNTTASNLLPGVLFLVSLVVNNWTCCAAQSIRSSFERLPIPPAHRRTWGRPRLWTASVYQATLKTMVEDRLPNVCRDLSSYAQLHNDDSLSDSRLRQTNVLKHLGIQHCPLGFPHGFTAIHIIHSHGGVAESDTVDRSLAKSRRRTVKVYRFKFPKRMTTDSLEFSQSKILVPMVSRFETLRCPKKVHRCRVTLLDGENVISRFVRNENPCEPEQRTTSESGIQMLHVVLNSTKILSKLFEERAELAAPLSDEDRFATLSIKVVCYDGMSAEIPSSARPTLVVLQASEAVSCPAKTIAEPIRLQTELTSAAPCRTLCRRLDHEINLSSPIGNTFPTLRLHAGMLSANVGRCEGSCDTRPMRGCLFDQVTYHALLLNALAKSHLLPAMTCAVNIKNLRSLWVPYAYDTPGTVQYTDCGIASIHQVTVARQGGCNCS